MKKRWRLRPHDTSLVAELAKRTNVPLIVAQLLLSRGIESADAISSFLDPKLTDLRDPELLPGMTKAADCLYASVVAGKQICIYGDYDADGMTATAILLGCLKLIGAQSSYYVPNRLEDGYGLSCEALTQLSERGKQTIVTVDCGIGSIAEAKHCRQLGLELIITDHHQLASELPDAAAIAHPMLPGHSYPFTGLCGAGVAFKLAWALCQRASNAKRVLPELREYLLEAIALAAIGTVADVVPLVDENRVLVRHGLKSLANKSCIGLKQLMQLTKLNEKSLLSSEDIGFTIAPRLNAAGRLGQAQLAVELLSTTDTNRAQALATYLDKLNGDRDSLERSIHLSASKQIKEQFDQENDSAFVLASPGWHPGVIGVVAGKLAERYHRPVIMIGLDAVGSKPGTGSARSPSRINLHEGLLSCRSLLISCGGHAAAAGLKIEEQNIPAFRAAFLEYVASEEGQTRSVPEISIDGEAALVQLDLNIVKQIEQMAPFGNGNPRPILWASGVELAEPPKPMGSGDRHFSGRFCQFGTTLRGVAFGQGDWVKTLGEFDGKLDIAFRPVINEFRGFSKVELQILDWRPSLLPDHPIVPGHHLSRSSAGKMVPG